MRLLNTRSLELEVFASGDVPAYAILSHTWEAGEVVYDQLQNGKHKSSPGWLKIQGSARAAAAQNLDYIWIDTCCIDKSSSAELTEAINSMFQWYARAQVCFVYLTDLAGPSTASDSPVASWSPFQTKEDSGGGGDDGGGPRSTTTTSRWFTRGWTLQELIAPREVEFYNQDWELFGTRGSLSAEIRAITGIPIDVLSFAPTGAIPDVSRLLELTSVAERMSWAARRETTREEDIAYSLLGLFDINMPLLYGEGRVKAFKRLQEEIIRATDDESIFVWRHVVVDGGGSPPPPPPTFSGLLADGPECFVFFTELIPRRSKYLSTRMKRGAGTAVSRRGVQIDLALTPFPGDASGTVYVALLACHMRRDASQAMFTPAVLLQRVSHEDETLFVRVRPDLIPLCMMNRIVAPPKLLYSMDAYLQKQQLQQQEQTKEKGGRGNGNGGGGGDATNSNTAPYASRVGRGLILKTVQTTSVFVPSTAMPSLMANGILFYPSIGPSSSSSSSDKGWSGGVRVESRSPTWQIFVDEAIIGHPPESYEINFGLSPVPAVTEMKEAVVCGALRLAFEGGGLLRNKTSRTCLVAGLEPLPANPLGTPGLYTVPWYAFEELDRVDSGDFARVKDPVARRQLWGPWPGVKGEFKFKVRYSGQLFYDLQLVYYQK